MTDLRAPFPWFGGKRRIAHEVWAALGDVDNYVEPFFGSGAVLLERPAWHQGRVETVNDLDRYVANFWRALSADPEGVARYADWPVSEADLEARHLWLVTHGAELIDSMSVDPEFYDVKVAGWWVWGICSWIGGGWCSGTGPWVSDGSRMVKRQDLDSNCGRGVSRKLPHLGDAGQGVNRQLPHLNGPQGISRASSADLSEYLSGLADRLRSVRVCNGDWQRVTTRGAISMGTSVGVFLDPPYLGEVRCGNLYSTDDHSIANDVREWCLLNGDDPRLRIVLAGYAAEHDDLMPDTWRRVEWVGAGAYKSAVKGAEDRAKGTDANRHQERLWLSPACLTGGVQDRLDFGMGEP